MVSQRIGRYEILYPLSRGGMAMVYLARDPAFERQVAVKIIPPQSTSDPEFRTRFQREAKVIGALEHPYIVPVYDYGVEGDQPYIVMRFMPGGTLADRIYGNPMPLPQVVPIMLRLGEAVDAAHRHGIIHCDLKPSNVLFDIEGRAFLSDFGIAKLLEGAPSLVDGSPLIGTPAYMSPEQCAGDVPLDGRSDVYSLGLILYETLTGRHPYGDADATMEMMRKQVSEPPPPIDGDALSLPQEINSVLAWALAKQPDARYATAGALARAVSALYDGPPGPPTPSKPLPVLARPVESVMPTPPSGSTTEVLPTTRPLPEEPVAAPPLWRRGWVSVPVVLALAWLFLALLGGGGGGRNTPTPTLTATSAVAASATAPVTSSQGVSTLTSPTALPTTATASATRTRTPAPVRPSPTSTPTVSPTNTRRPASATPTRTATLTPSPTPNCVPPEFFDPFLGRCVLPPPPPTATPGPP
ncbi:MAG: serine/threonine protein kinase [Anaerolineales bacterium]